MSTFLLLIGFMRNIWHSLKEKGDYKWLKNLNTFVQKMSPEAQAMVDKKARAMLAEMPLNELRQARGLSQKTG